MSFSNSLVTLVLFGWGIEFGKYYCGGAPDRWENGYFRPAVPVTWSYGFGIHFRAPWVLYSERDSYTGPWGWHRRWWYSAYQYSVSNSTGKEE